MNLQKRRQTTGAMAKGSKFRRSSKDVLFIKLSRQRRFDELAELLWKEKLLLESNLLHADEISETSEKIRKNTAPSIHSNIQKSISTVPTMVSMKTNEDDEDEYDLDFLEHKHMDIPPSLLLLHEILVFRPPLVVVDVVYHLLNIRAQLMSQSRHFCVQKDQKQQSKLSDIEMKQSRNKHPQLISCGVMGKHLSPLDVTDCNGRKPMHIAVIHRCGVDVIHFLLSSISCYRQVSDPCMHTGTGAVCDDTHSTFPLSVDRFGRTPLHYASGGPDGDKFGALVNVQDTFCASPNHAMPSKATDTLSLYRTGLFRNVGYSGLFSDTGTYRCGINSIRNREIENQIEVVYTLMRMYPASAFIIDNQGMTPIDLARKYQSTGVDDPRILLSMLKHTSRISESRAWGTSAETELSSLKNKNAHNYYQEMNKTNFTETPQHQQLQTNLKNNSSIAIRGPDNKMNLAKYHIPSVCHDADVVADAKLQLHEPQKDASKKLDLVSGLGRQELKLDYKAYKYTKKSTAASSKPLPSVIITNCRVLSAIDTNIVDEPFFRKGDDDDISSVGSRGVSVCHDNRQRKHEHQSNHNTTKCNTGRSKRPVPCDNRRTFKSEILFI